MPESAEAAALANSCRRVIVIALLKMLVRVERGIKHPALRVPRPSVIKDEEVGGFVGERLVESGYREMFLRSRLYFFSSAGS